MTDMLMIDRLKKVLEKRKGICHKFYLAAVIVILLLSGCSDKKEEKLPEASAVTTSAAIQTENGAAEITDEAAEISVEQTLESEEAETEKNAQPGTENAVQSVKNNGEGRLIAIDAGHQARGNNEKEPIGPGSAEMKAKVTTGTAGKTTGLAESELNLAVSMKLKEELINRGYQVLMIRETQNVNISNAERANIANEAGAAAFVRIHADGAENESVSGASALCQSASNVFNGNMYEKCRRLSECVLNEMTALTGGKKRSVIETDSMSGINWASVPVTIVEMGFMTNPEEEILMSTEEYQWKIAKGIANGLDLYFSE